MAPGELLVAATLHQGATVWLVQQCEAGTRRPLPREFAHGESACGGPAVPPPDSDRCRGRKTSWKKFGVAAGAKNRCESRQFRRTFLRKPAGLKMETYRF
jgi:hypothetical protein